jgi:hypothetical protein
MTLGLSVLASATAPPLDPTALEAHDQLLHELSNPIYQAAQPTLLQIIQKFLSDWFNSLNPSGVPGLSGLGSLGSLAIIVVVLAALVVAFLVFGVPRLNRRSRSVGSLFGDEDERDSEALRRAADAAAAAGDYATAIAEQFRSIARGLAERTILTTFPGTTAHGFAEQAANPFPASSADLRAAANAFDRVRYLGLPGTEQEWSAVRRLGDELRTAKPVLEGAPV